MRKVMTGKASTVILVAAIGFAQVSEGWAQQRLRAHTATEAKPVQLLTSNRKVRGSKVSITVRGNTRRIVSNGLPDHRIANLKNPGSGQKITAQSYAFSMPVSPRVTGRATQVGLRTLIGVAVNGVPFDPAAAEYWQGNRNSGWQYEALGGALNMTFDASYAHLQPNGAYHYHGLPVGLMQALGWSKSNPSPLIGYAADGFPIYAITATMGGQVKEMQSSYRLRSGNRPGGGQPGGRYDGTFTQDYVYVAGAGDLDECNGAHVVTAEYPQGTYAYFLTASFPVVPRCLKGAPDASFAKSGPGGGARRSDRPRPPRGRG